MQIELANYCLKVKNGHAEYHELRRKFLDSAQSAIEQFEQSYQEQNHSLDDVVNNANSQLLNCLKPVIQQCTQILIQRSIWNLDESMFWEYYGKYHINAWLEAYRYVEGQFAEIIMTQEQLDEYRKLRREHRGKFVGGGFGLAGAAKGMATAGALNIASGAVHTIFNGIGKVISDSKADSEKREIYNNPETKASLTKAVFSAVFNLHYAVLDCINEKTEKPILGIVTNETVRQAGNLLNNAKLHIRNEQEKWDALLQSVDLNPYDFEWYQTFIDCFGDPEGHISEMASFFGVTELEAYKRNLVERFADGIFFHTESEALQAKEKLSSYTHHLSFHQPVQKLQEIDDALQRFDVESRTVDGILCATCEEAQVARQQIDEIYRILQAVNNENIETISEAIQKLKSYDTAVASKYQLDLKKRFEQLELFQRTVDGIVFKTTEEAVIARRQADEIQKILYSVNAGYEDIEKLREALNKLEIYPDNLAEKYRLELKARLGKLDMRLRTVDGVLYNTPEDANRVRRENSEIQEIFQAVNAAKIETYYDALDKLKLYKSDLSLNYQAILTNQLEGLKIQLCTVNLEMEGVQNPVLNSEQEAVEAQKWIEEVREQIRLGWDDEIVVAQILQFISSSSIPTEVTEPFYAIVRDRQKELDSMARTAFGEIYDTQEQSIFLRKQYEEINHFLQLENPQKMPEWENIYSKIESIGFPERVKNQLKARVAHIENNKVIKRNLHLNPILILFIILLVGSIFFKVSVTKELTTSSVEIFGCELLVHRFETVSALDFADGLKNGFFILGHTFIQGIIEAVKEYIAGFRFGFIGNVLWLCLGWVWTVFKQLLLFLPRYLLTLILTFFQKAQIGYYIGYLLGAGLPYFIGFLKIRLGMKSKKKVG